MASIASPLTIMHQWNHPYEGGQKANTADHVDGHPTSASPPNQQRSFICAGCSTLREGTLVSQANLNERLALTYPWMLTSTKTAILTTSGEDTCLKYQSSIVGYMCRGCTLFHKKTGLAVPNLSGQVAKIERVFITINGQTSTEEASKDPRAYLQHLKDDPHYIELTSSGEDILQIIRENEIKSFAELAQYFNTQADQNDPQFS